MQERIGVRDDLTSSKRFLQLQENLPDSCGMFSAICPAVAAANRQRRLDELSAVSLAYRQL